MPDFNIEPHCCGRALDPQLIYKQPLGTTFEFGFLRSEHGISRGWGLFFKPGNLLIQSTLNGKFAFVVLQKMSTE